MLESEIGTHFVAGGDLWFALKILQNWKMLSPFYINTNKTNETK